MFWNKNIQKFLKSHLSFKRHLTFFFFSQISVCVFKKKKKVSRFNNSRISAKVEMVNILVIFRYYKFTWTTHFLCISNTISKTHKSNISFSHITYEESNHKSSTIFRITISFTRFLLYRILNDKRLIWFDYLIRFSTCLHVLWKWCITRFKIKSED